MPKLAELVAAARGHRRAGMVVAAVTLAAMTFSAPCGFAEVSGFMRAYGPVARLQVSRPTLVWEVWGAGDCRLTAFSMRLNGAPIECAYDAASRRLWARPAAPLAPGEYTVECKAEVDGVLPLARSWSFSVAGSASPELPGPSAEQLAALDAVNAVRAGAQLPAVEPDPALCAAAQSHSAYMLRNDVVGHDEAGTGGSLLARLGAFGFVGGADESVGFVENLGFAQTVRALFDAPYHRIGFLQPGRPAAGAGVADGRVTLDFGLTSAEAVVVSPANGQADVPEEWDAVETPNPMRLHGGASRTGYPIVVAEFGPKARRIVDGDVRLDGPNGPVECYLNTPKTDERLDSALILLPVRALAPGRYDATAALRLADGTRSSVRWSFVVG